MSNELSQPAVPEKKGGFLLTDEQQSVFNEIFLHIDGISTASTLFSLEQKKIFPFLAAASEPLSIVWLANRFHAKNGYFHVAINLLIGLGFVQTGAQQQENRPKITVTGDGRIFFRKAHLYNQVPSLFDLALQLTLPANEIQDRLPHIRKQLAIVTQALPPVKDDTDKVISGHLRGILIGSTMQVLHSTGFFAEFDNRSGNFRHLYDFAIHPELLTMYLDILKPCGWIRQDQNRICLTPTGLIAGSAAVQYMHPVSYLPLLQRIPQLIFGDKEFPQKSTNGMEGHLDREMDINFSGAVFNKTCRHPLFAVLLPLFNEPPLSEQPCAVVDTGAGNGTVLIALYQAIKENTLRGQHLQQYPLLMIGVEYNRVAEKICKKHLEEADIPGLTFSGDIGNPGDIAAKLAEHGINPENVLHVNKSVIHNRNYQPPLNLRLAKKRTPLSRAVYADSNGDLIPNSYLEQNLLDFFAAWRPWIRQHGMVVIEAHCCDPALALSHIGYRVLISLEATHGYSHQYLMKYKTFINLVTESDLQIVSGAALGQEILDQPLLSVHHFKPVSPANTIRNRSPGAQNSGSSTA